MQLLHLIEKHYIWPRLESLIFAGASCNCQNLRCVFCASKKTIDRSHDLLFFYCLCQLHGQFNKTRSELPGQNLVGAKQTFQPGIWQLTSVDWYRYCYWLAEAKWFIWWRIKWQLLDPFKWMAPAQPLIISNLHLSLPFYQITLHEAVVVLSTSIYSILTCAWL